MKIIFCSLNEAKLIAATTVFNEIFGKPQIIPLGAASGVNRTPFSHEEIILGCENRIRFAQEHDGSADLYVAAEGGVYQASGRMMLGVYVVAENRMGTVFTATSCFVELPKAVAIKLRPDSELSELIKEYPFPIYLKDQQDQIGTNGLITQGEYTRIDEFTDALRLALISYKK